MSNSDLTFIHLSDIHFQKKKSDGKYDLDADLRNELERDARIASSNFEKIDGVLITGDIAFSGNESEYKTAGEWLKKLCGIVGCPPENIWMVPGNHDVDRDIVRKSILLKQIHERLRDSSPIQLDKLIHDYNTDSAAKDLLYTSIDSYNRFASRFRCNFDAERPFWDEDFTLNDGSILKIRGINSTLVSDQFDDDRLHKLVVGTVPVVLKRDDGVCYLTLCHHPPQWLVDQDAVDDHLVGRAKVQLFGHKHEFKALQANQSLKLAAGAVHPERDGSTWQPRYNLLRIWVERTDVQRLLKVEVHARVWRPGYDSCFVPDYQAGGKEYTTYSLALDPWDCPMEESQPLPNLLSKSQTAQAQLTDPCKQEGLGVNQTRKLTYRFFSMPFRARLQIAQKFDLVSDEDDKLNDIDMTSLFIKRAVDRNILSEMLSEIEKQDNQ